MREIRPIQPEETEEFLQLLCVVFRLDLIRTREIFYKEPFFDLNRKWALIENKKMLSILTTTPLQFGFGSTIGIAGVATHPRARHKGLAKELLTEVLRHAKESQEGSCLLFARDTRLYEQIGFCSLDTVIRGKIRSTPKMQDLEPASIEQILSTYTAWADAHPLRLKRDSKRWRFWFFLRKTCLSHQNGYLCFERNTIREALLDPQLSYWPLGPQFEWVGLKHLTQELNVPVVNPTVEMTLMGYEFSNHPQMFMTDQF
jgi:predicted acetyltransferase